MTRAISSQDYRDSSPFDHYLSRIKEIDLLTADQERAYGSAIQRGEKWALDRMIEANLRLVVKIARDPRYKNRGLALDDLIGEGNLGLIRACVDFDPDFGTRFSTYASCWIKQAIRSALTNTAAPIRLPAHMVGLLGKWWRTERQLSRENGQAPTHDEIAEKLGLTEAQKSLVEYALRAGQIRFECGSPDEAGWTADDTPDHRASAAVDIEEDDYTQYVLKRMERLDERERQIITMRFGLGGRDEMTLRDVGLHIKVTREWVRKIELKALEKMHDDYVPPPTVVQDPEVAGRRRRRNRSTASRREAPPRPSHNRRARVLQTA